ncbi:MAG TPA: Gfo/Idh/MocA family oxidoreductase [bacterium]|nr:Gfo/Idh/MocA family oxidoreductase [bacterium]
MNPVRVGVIGVGQLGRFHALNYSHMDEANLVGVYDIDHEKAAGVAREAGCGVFETLDRLLDQIEGVSIAVPTDRHFEVGMHALRKGVHCLIEKPISRNLEEADGLIKAAERRDAVLHIGHIERFNPALQALNRVTIQPLFVEAHRLAPFTPRGCEVSVVLDLMIHDIDIILQWVRSPLRSLSASGVAVISNTVDIANARLIFQNGCVANLTASRISQKKMRKMRLFQKDTYISVDFLNQRAEVFRLGSESDKRPGEKVVCEMAVLDRKSRILLHRPRVPKVLGLEQELRHFLKSIREGSGQGVSGQHGREALQVAIRILKDIEVNSAAQNGSCCQ